MIVIILNKIRNLVSHWTLKKYAIYEEGTKEGTKKEIIKWIVRSSVEAFAEWFKARHE